MSDSENKWRKKALKLQIQLKKQEQTLKEYKRIIKNSNSLIQITMNNLNTELKIAEQIHDLLLPLELPVISDCHFSFKFYPTEHNGGGKDFYEVFPHRNKKKFSIIMSSCSSHALSALLLSARLKMMGKQHQLEELKPNNFIHYVIKEMDSGVSKNLPQQKNLTKNLDLFYCIIDQKTYKMSYCLIGKITVLIHTATSGKVKILEPCADSLEKKSRKKLISKVIALDRGDRLIVCSPGVLDLPLTHSKINALDKLKKIIQNQPADSTVHNLRNDIMYTTRKYFRGKPVFRDQSIVLMEIKKHILKLTTHE